MIRLLSRPTGRSAYHGGTAVHPTRRRLVGLIGAAMLAVAAVAPAAAETPLLNSGSYGYYEIHDTSTSAGVKCVYEGSKTQTSQGKAYLLDKLRIRKPTVHHTTSGKNWVGWRYVVKRDANYDGSYSEVFRSSILKAKASTTAIAPFSDRIWTAPEPFSKLKGNWLVRVHLFWYKPGSTTKVQGRIVAELDYYIVRGGGPDTKRMNSCNGAN